jgi:hypothetical protein
MKEIKRSKQKRREEDEKVKVEGANAERSERE